MLCAMLDLVNTTTSHSDQAMTDVTLQLSSLTEQGSVNGLQQGLDHLTNVLCHLQQQSHDAERGQDAAQRLVL